MKDYDNVNAFVQHFVKIKISLNKNKETNILTKLPFLDIVTSLVA